MLESKIIPIRRTLLCFLCKQPIERSEALRLRWNPSQHGVGLLGYFHPLICGVAMNAALQEKREEHGTKAR